MVWPSRFPQRAAFLLGTALLATAGPSAVAPAGAAPYEVWSCRDASGAPIAADAWFVNHEFMPASSGSTADDCATGGGFRVALRPGQAHSISGVELRFDVPRGTKIVDYELWRSAEVPSNPSFYEAGVDEFSDGGVVANVACSSFGIACGTDASTPLAAANRVAKQAAAPIDLIKVYARCRDGSCQPGAAPPAETTLYRSRVVLDDPTAPAAAAIEGTLLAGTVTQGGLGTIQVAGHDGQSGVAAVSLSLDDGPASTMPAGNALNGCRTPFVSPRPCPSDFAPVFAVDTATLAPGPHVASGTVTDAAGNQTSWGPVAFTVEAPPAPPTPPLPPPAPAVVAGIPDNGRPAVLQPRVRMSVARGGGSRAARVSGTVHAPDGTAIVGARIALRGRPLGTDRNRERTLATAVTDGRGRFRVAALPAGAYRVSASFVPWKGSPPTVTKQVRTRSTLRVTAQARPRRLVRGHATTLSGRLLGAGPATRGTLVQIEAIVRGRWRPVGTARVGSDGRWRWRYRFVRISRPTRFAFRATVAAAPAWPWGVRHSPRQHVRVDP
jgi:hypothetical protein